MNSMSFPNVFRLVGFLIIFVSGVNGQKPQAHELMRSDVLVDESRTSISMCLETSDRTFDERYYWFRLVNNSIWAITFNAESNGIPENPLKLPDGKRVSSLADNAVSTPRYQLTPHDAGSANNLTLIDTTDKPNDKRTAIKTDPPRHYMGRSLYKKLASVGQIHPI